MKYWIQVHLAYAVKGLKYFHMKYSIFFFFFANTTWEMAFHRNLRIFNIVIFVRKKGLSVLAM